jgi:hypothetical protein
MKKDKDTSAIEEKLSKDIDALLKIQGLTSIILESASRIYSFVPIMKTETAKPIISKFFEAYAQES